MAPKGGAVESLLRMEKLNRGGVVRVGVRQGWGWWVVVGTVYSLGQDTQGPK